MLKLTDVSRPAKEPPLPRRNGKLQKAAPQCGWGGVSFACLHVRASTDDFTPICIISTFAY